MALTASMAIIAGRDHIVELPGFPVPLGFQIGGMRGNVVTRSTTAAVHRGWRLVAVEGVRYGPGEVARALEAAHASHKHKLKLAFRIGDDDAPSEGTEDFEAIEKARRAQEEKAARLAEAARQHSQDLLKEAEEMAEARKRAAEVRKQAEEARKRLEERRKEAEELEKMRKEEEEQRQRAAEAAEMERKRIEEQLRKEAEELARM